MWKLYVEKLICNEVARCEPASLRKKLFRISSFTNFAFIFSESMMITSSKETFKVCEHISFRKYKRKVVLLVIYLFNQHWSESTCWIWHLKFSWVQFLSNTLFFCRLKLYTQAEIALKKDMWSIIRASDLLGPLSNNLKHEHLKVH